MPPISPAKRRGEEMMLFIVATVIWVGVVGFTIGFHLGCQITEGDFRIGEPINLNNRPYDWERDGI